MIVRGEPFEVAVREDAVRGHVFGDGPTVLLAHGWGGHAGQMSSFVQPLVRAGYRVVVFDMPAHGRSSGRLASLVHFADTIAAVHELYPAHAIIAHSFGAGATTLAMAKRKLVDRLVFVAPPARYSSVFEKFRTGVGLSRSAFAVMMKDVEQWLDVKVADLGVERMAPRLEGDLLVIHDSGDREISVNDGRVVALCWPNAKLETTNGLGHSRILHDPHVIARTVRFIATGA